MPYDPDVHHRRSIRLRGYDYAQAGAYFVTVCVQGRECLFGEIENGELRSNEYGQIAARYWEWLAQQYPYVDLDEWIVMPNHFHGILVIVDGGRRGGSRTAPTTAAVTKHKPLGRLIGAFKTVATKHINILRDTPGATLWQRNYYEHIIRNETDLHRIRDYIAGNPAKWLDDQLHPNNPSKW